MLEGKNLGRWEKKEHHMYYIFLTVNEKLFEKKDLRRSDKVFKLMASYIGTRTSDQCRSHHQKIESKSGSVAQILENLASEFGPIDIKEILSNNEGLSIQTSDSTLVTGSPFQKATEPLEDPVVIESI